MIDYSTLKKQLDTVLDEYYNTDFIAEDPISIPHSYTSLQDVEISAFFAAIFAWGNRKMIVNKTKDFMSRMDNSPYQFITQFTNKDLHVFQDFKHRTFNAVDAVHFLTFLQQHYQQHNSLETAFSDFLSPDDKNVQNALIGFHDYCFKNPESPRRSQKHISTPIKNSACKRLNMLLRWLVRKDKVGVGVDLGIWKTIQPAQLLIPLDVHVERQARNFELITHTNKWQQVLEITHHLQQLCPEDPVKYDFALFGLGQLHKSYQ